MTMAARSSAALMGAAATEDAAVAGVAVAGVAVAAVAVAAVAVAAGAAACAAVLCCLRAAAMIRWSRNAPPMSTPTATSSTSSQAGMAVTGEPADPGVLVGAGCRV